MTSSWFKKVINKTCLQITYILGIKGMMCHKTQSNETSCLTEVNPIYATVFPDLRAS